MSKESSKCHSIESESSVTQLSLNRFYIKRKRRRRLSLNIYLKIFVNQCCGTFIDQHICNNKTHKIIKKISPISWRTSLRIGAAIDVDQGEHGLGTILFARYNEMLSICKRARRLCCFREISRNGFNGGFNHVFTLQLLNKTENIYLQKYLYSLKFPEQICKAVVKFQYNLKSTHVLYESLKYIVHIRIY